MDENFDTTEYLTRYLDGDLSAAEKARLEEQLRHNEALRAELEGLQLAAKAIRYYGLRNQVGRIHQEEISRPNKGRGKMVQMRSPLRRMLAVAAIFLVLVSATLVIYTSTLSGNKVYNEAFVAYSLSASRSGASLQGLKKAYQEGDYQRVITLGRSGNLSGEEALLLGLSYLNTNQPAKAIQQLSLVNRSGNPYRQDAQFYLALAHLKANHYTEALALFTAICNDTAHLYYNYVCGKMISDLRLLALK